MIRSSSAVITVLVFTGFQIVTISSQMCIECASPTLRNNWQLTAYPKIYTDDKFDTGCDNGEPNFGVAVSCSSYCVEMIIPTPDAGYAMLRGCLDNLMTPENRPNVVLENSDKTLGDCAYGPIDRRVNIMDVGKIVANDTGYLGIHFCQSAAGLTSASVLCNNIMTLKKMADRYDPKAADYPKAQGFFEMLLLKDRLTCAAASNYVNCLSCSSADDNGACDKNNKNTPCQGTYCTKTFGKQGPMDIVKRGCSPINPYGLKTDGCAWVDFKTSLPMSDGTAGGAPRTKRDTDLSLTYAANQCFCQGDRCNSATSITFAFFTILTPIFVAVKVL
uniref:Protein quiver n=1 Tax=Plectus sambesii TaxID=2011161 RepID=A0A914XS36_9BILA